MDNANRNRYQRPRQLHARASNKENASSDPTGCDTLEQKVAKRRENKAQQKAARKEFKLI